MFDKYIELKSKGITPILFVGSEGDDQVVSFVRKVRDIDTGAETSEITESMTKTELLKHIKQLRKRLNAAKEVYELVFGPEV